MSNQLHTETVNFFQAPDLDKACPATEGEEITLGDLHGNASKLLYSLVRHGVMQLPPRDYEQLVGIYRTPTHKLTLQHLRAFNAILSRATTLHRGKIRLLAADLAGSGKNDFFTLQIIRWLSIQQHRVDILLSKHNLEFLLKIERKEAFSHTNIMDNEPVSSMSGLEQLIQRGLVSREYIEHLIQKHYLPYLKPIAYTVNQSLKEITLFSHSPMDLECINGMAKKLKCTYSDDFLENLASTIDTINQRFSWQAQAGQLTSLININIFKRDIDAEPIDPQFHPFEYAISNQNTNGLVRFAHFRNYHMAYSHRHPVDSPTGNLFNFRIQGEQNGQVVEYQFLYSANNIKQKNTLLISYTLAMRALSTLWSGIRAGIVWLYRAVARNPCKKNVSNKKKAPLSNSLVKPKSFPFEGLEGPPSVHWQRESRTERKNKSRSLPFIGKRLTLSRR